MTRSFSGSYPIETREGEIERLLTQSAAMEPDARAMLDLIGLEPGARCLDVGCGPGGITALMSEMVGETGHVIGLDRNPAFLEFARVRAPANVSFVQGDAFAADLPDGQFDLVHMRFVASTSGDPERLIKEAARLSRPGGVVALQEPDASSLTCYPPHPAWDALKAALIGAFRGVGADLELARRLYFVVCRCGLEGVAYRTSVLAVRAGDPMADYLPSTVESLRGAILKLDLMSVDELDAALAACRVHLAQPETSFTMYTVAQVWGRA